MVSVQFMAAIATREISNRKDLLMLDISETSAIASVTIFWIMFPSRSSFSHSMESGILQMFMDFSEL
uniref:Uncharacterized protein n=1 Tax=Octopus bimaculoides TaxID=37653 RepID=A0A0L8HQC3_OCTBM